MHSVCPLDSKYKHIVEPVTRFFTDFELTKSYYQIEIDYYFDLMKFLGYDDALFEKANFFFRTHREFTDSDYAFIKEIEKKNGHHIKAVEVYFRNNLKKYVDDPKLVEFTHFGLTSQDIMSLAIVNAVKLAHAETCDKFKDVLKNINEVAIGLKQAVIPARTHGQNAVPTTLLYQFARYDSRLLHTDYFINYMFSAKFGGAIGEMNAFSFTYPEKNWSAFLNGFIGKYGMNRSMSPTQTDNYDSVCDNFDMYSKNCLVLENLCQDIWDYISRNYFKLKVTADYVGSSTMSQKINPVNFENAEGNFEIADHWFGFFSKKLRKSRLQRDLTDSTAIRNIGLTFGYYYLALNSFSKGLDQLEFNRVAANIELEKSYSMLAEAVQHELRKIGIPDAYNEVKDLFIGTNSMTGKDYVDAISIIAAKFGNDENKASFTKLKKLSVKDYAMYYE